MANNVLITPGSGDIVAAENISTVKFQQVKLIDSTAGSITPVGTSVNPLNITAGTGATGLGKAAGATAGASDTGVAMLVKRVDSPATITPSVGQYTTPLVNSLGALYTTGGGSTQFAADSGAHTSGDSGTAMLAVRRDANTTLASVSGNYAPPQLDASGSLKVAITSGAGSGGTSLADQAAFTSSTTSFTPVGALYQSSADTLGDGHAAALAVDINRFLKVTKATLDAGEDLTNNVQGITQKAVAASTYSPSLYNEITQVTKAAVKGSAGNVLSFYISNANAAVRFFQLHNKATAPAGTDVPVYSFPVPAGTANNPGVLELGTEFWTGPGRYFATGIGWAISTTYGTFTDSATTTEHVAYVHYV